MPLLDDAVARAYGDLSKLATATCALLLVLIAWCSLVVAQTASLAKHAPGSSAVSQSRPNIGHDQGLTTGHGRQLIVQSTRDIPGGTWHLEPAPTLSADTLQIEMFQASHGANAGS